MDLNNKLCVVTGANSGIGFETTKELVRQGAFVVMVCRNEDKAIAAKQKIQQEINGGGIEIVLCDFSIQSEIRSAAEKIKSTYQTIDMLINNHGLVAAKYEETVDGLEYTFAVNHIGYFLFTNLLLDHLKAAEKARIINVASDAHKGGRFDPDNIQLKNGYSNWTAYGNSKLYNILFTAELADRLKETNVTVNCLHPGVIRSNFGNNGSGAFKLFWKIGGPFMKSNRQGAETTIYLATSDEVEDVNGAYFKNSKVTTPSKTARNKEYAEQLWAYSEKVIEN